MKPQVVIEFKKNNHIAEDDFVTVTIGRFFKKHYSGRIQKIDRPFLCSDYMITLDMSIDGASCVMDIASSSIHSIQYENRTYLSKELKFKSLIVNSKNEHVFVGEKVLLIYHDRAVVARFNSHHYEALVFDASLDYHSDTICIYNHKEISAADFELIDTH